MPGLETAVGILNTLFPAFLFSMSPRHLRVACSVAVSPRKARLYRLAVVPGGVVAAASFARRSACSFTSPLNGIGPT